jgi:hypothetical protein
MVLALAANEVGGAIDALNVAGERAFDIGEIVSRADGAPSAVVM